MYFFKFIVFLIFICIVSAQKEIFNAKKLQEMHRISSPVLSPDGLYVIYEVRKWNSETDKSYTNLQYSSIETKEVKDLTPKVEGASDYSPYFSSLFPDYVFFTRDGQIRYIKFPPSDSDKDYSFQLTKYPIDINDFKIKHNAILFSADVYFSCQNNLNCSAELIKKEENMDYQVYDSLFAFHWDTWLVQGKGSHLFYQKIKLINDKIELDGEVTDITKGMEINCPPLFSDITNYDLSSDGTKVTFSAHHITHDEAWNTSWKTYYIDLNLMKNPILISGHNAGRTQSPQFSIDNTQIAYLAMNTPLLEAENLHFEIYNILTNKINIIDDPLDISVNEFMWINSHTIRFTAEIIGQIKIYDVNIMNPTKPIFSLFETKSDLYSYGLPFTALKNKKNLLSIKVGYNYPDSIVSLLENKEEEEIVNLNKDTLNEIELSKPELFNFTGGYNDTVYGWIFKPTNFDPNKKYPVALLIHGGPESSWTSGWSYRWNPQLFANQGYAVIMVNPHGSTGVSTSFREAVRNDFGGVPFEDIIIGLKFAIKNNNYMDSNNVCAAGGSYGGYMINWIEGHGDAFDFKCLVNHDGDFSGVAQFYGTDELWYEMTEYCPIEKSGCKPYEGKSIRDGFEKYSNERYVKNWKTPMLVIHGGRDYRVPITEGISTFTALQLKGVESKLLYFPMENHWVLNPPNQVKWYEQVLDWFDKHTKQ